MNTQKHDEQSPRAKRRENLLALVEGAMMVALAIVLDLLCKLIPSVFPYGGSISLFSIPLFYYSYRRGWRWGIGAGLVLAVVQMITGFYAPPANTLFAVFLCILLDYIIAFTLLGTASLFAAPFSNGSGRRRLVGYVVGAFGASALRFIFSYISGIVLWDSYCPEGMSLWLYSLIYNGGYMLPNAIIAAVALAILCPLVDPRTLRPMKFSKKAI